MINLTRGVPADESFPLEALRECAAEAVQTDVLKYGDGYGYKPLREYLAQSNGASLEQVMVTNGSLQFVDLLGLSLLKAGDVVLVESPTYDRTLTLLRRHGVVPVGVRLEADGVDLEAFEAAVKQHKPKMFYVVADFQNPSGSVMSLVKRKRVVELAEQYGFWVLEDSPYRPLRYSGEPVPSLRELNPKVVLQMSSYSKQIGPGVRVGYMLGDAEVLKSLAKAANDTYISAGFTGQAIANAFLRRGLLEGQLEQLRQLYAPRLNAMVAALNQHLPGALETAPEGGFFLSISLPKQHAMPGLLSKATEVGLSLSDGRGFFVNPSEGERFLRLPFCALTHGEIDDGVERLAGLLKS